MGTPVKVTARDGDWWKVETPEGYTGFIRSNTLQGLDDEAMRRWREASRAVVCTDRTVFVLSAPDSASDRVSDVVGGVILEIDLSGGCGDMAAVILPDGRRGYIESGLLMPIEQWASQDWDPSEIPVYARRLTGTPYVWGGTSLKGMDCSGLTQICAYRQGVMLPRDASQQVRVGTPVDKSDVAGFLPGDLLFFGNVTTGKVTHVAISMGGPRYIHSSARVRTSSLSPSDSDYENPGLVAVRRIDPATALRLSLRSHPFYF